MGRIDRKKKLHTSDRSLKVENLSQTGCFNSRQNPHGVFNDISIIPKKIKVKGSPLLGASMGALRGTSTEGKTPQQIQI